MAAAPTQAEPEAEIETQPRPTVRLGERTLCALHALLHLPEHEPPDVVATCENGFWPELWPKVMAALGYADGISAPKDEAPNSRPGRDGEGDGSTGNVSCASGFKFLEKYTGKFPDSKQVFVLLILRDASSGTIVVQAVAHFKSGTKNLAEEKARAAQMTYLARLVKTHVYVHDGAAVGIIAADCNASLHTVRAKDGSLVPPLLSEAAEAEGFVAALPVETDGLDRDSKEFMDFTWSSQKFRNVGGREENQQRDGAAPDAKKAKTTPEPMLEEKCVANDFSWLYVPKQAAGRVTRNTVKHVDILKPPIGGPCDATGMATWYSDHTVQVLKISFGDGLEYIIAFVNLLAPGLDEEMVKPIPSCIHPDDEEVARLAVQKTARTTFRYDYGGSSKPGAVIAAPYGLHHTQAEKSALLEHIAVANATSIHLEGVRTGTTAEEVVKRRERAFSRCSHFGL